MPDVAWFSTSMSISSMGGWAQWVENLTGWSTATGTTTVTV